jgi:REP element-mobilizing transposase RayT
MTYLLTFSCYASHLHGDERGSIDRSHNRVGGPARPAEPGLWRFERDEMKEEPYLLDEIRRQIVLVAMIDVCAFRGWALLAGHVRMNHVHAVVEAPTRPEHIMADFKEYASRALNRSGLDRTRRKRWTRHGSMKRLFDRAARDGAIRYVLGSQGEPMAIYVAPEQRAS